MKMIKPIVNLSKIASDYDTFVFGFNGVLYDGEKILPDAIKCLKNLSSIGKQIVIISNTHLRIAEVVDILKNNYIDINIFSNIQCF